MTPPLPAPLVRHLRRWLGAWPEPDGGEVSPVVVATSRSRVEPGWDGHVVPLVGISAGPQAVVSVEPHLLDAAPQGATLEDVERWVSARLGRAGGFGRVVYRWQSELAAIPELPEPGVWRDPRVDEVPAWLRPFNGGVLVAEIDGEVAAGVGVKRHDDDAWELAVVTEPAHRGRGLGRALVAQAARRTIREGAVALYLHRADNTPSAALAAGAGFPDRGWRLLVV